MSLKFGLGDLKNIFDRPKPSPVTKAVSDESNVNIIQTMDSIYNVDAENWYTAKPYGFKSTSRLNVAVVMFLPISPNNLNITTNFATNIIPTLYGTVEEHSDVRYYDISISGTTGFAPRFVAPTGKSVSDAYSAFRKGGRSSFSIAEGVALSGFFSKTVAAIKSIQNKNKSAFEGSQLKTKNGFDAADSGYVAFHNLYRFLLAYKKDTAGIDGSSTPRSKHPLTFFNYKDNNEYDVAVRSFTLIRSAENPMLYNYSIQLRGYNIRSSGSRDIKDNLKQRLIDLGLDGIDGSSILGDIKTIADKAKGIIGAAVGGLNVLGR
jgi:hypothetical protein